MASTMISKGMPLHQLAAILAVNALECNSLNVTTKSVHALLYDSSYHLTGGSVRRALTSATEAGFLSSKPCTVPLMQNAWEITTSYTLTEKGRDAVKDITDSATALEIAQKVAGTRNA